MVLEISDGCFEIVLLAGQNSATCFQTFERKRPALKLSVKV